MKKIGLLSDTHSYLDERVLEHFKECDEVWHAGDFGDAIISEQLLTFKPMRGVFGNVDGTDVRALHPLDEIFLCEEVKVFITHIGGYPGNYSPEAKRKIIEHKPDLFICGHSHILKVMRDRENNLLHINPGASGKHGMHKVRTIIRFQIDGKKIENCEVIELGLRSAID